MSRYISLIWIVLFGLLATSSLVQAALPVAKVDAQTTAQRPRPGASYLHGPFVVVHLALGLRSVGSDSRLVNHVRHVTLRDRSAIQALVRAINRIPTLEVFPKVAILCPQGAAVHTGPAWLSFVRPDDTIIHAFESGPGVCGDLAVNGTRWMLDHGAVWEQIMRLTERPANLLIVKSSTGMLAE